MNHGLYGFFFQCIGLHVLRKLLLALGGCVLGYCLSICSMKAPFFPMATKGLADVFRCQQVPFHGDSQTYSSRIGVRLRLDFCLQNAPDRDSSGFKSGKYSGQSARVQNSANNCWVVLVVWTGACEICQKTYFLSGSEPRGRCRR